MKKNEIKVCRIPRKYNTLLLPTLKQHIFTQLWRTKHNTDWSIYDDDYNNNDDNDDENNNNRNDDDDDNDDDENENNNDDDNNDDEDGDNNNDNDNSNNDNVNNHDDDNDDDNDSIMLNSKETIANNYSCSNSLLFNNKKANLSKLTVYYMINLYNIN